MYSIPLLQGAWSMSQQMATLKTTSISATVPHHDLRGLPERWSLHNTGRPEREIRSTSVLPSFCFTRSYVQDKQEAMSSDASTSDIKDSSQQPLKAPESAVHYEGPLSKTHKLLKIVSLSNTAIACAAAPAIIMYADHISYVSRVGLSSSLVLFGILTTGALHWITNPYVHVMDYEPATQQVDVVTTSLLGTRRKHSFNLSDVLPLPWNRPVATFMAKNRFYYIDVYSFPDDWLLKRLTPDDTPEGHKDDEDDD
ncbi:hypothetical protein CEUSTIGMA_g3538.t1 [Chlamydomonas eustigma]|uniref:Transmembrane protein 186 n=1 Tax=Chlamydomonas eustigma TaxID=1157962 RepID=A0A250WZ83_9CHLO|nr:hypothetical protein CEUSTIGMA_g3538.t1 [Chlamydomonas eustigma]|eukprot:GAX76095.1 hypothetical protein CEUSTIGMA_g3538.t1 [Chlamydomonas eustigma]